MKKVISYSLWGDNPLYTKGAIKNAVARAEFYPEWEARMYIDKDSVPVDVTNWNASAWS